MDNKTLEDTKSALYKGALALKYFSESYEELLGIMGYPHTEIYSPNGQVRYIDSPIESTSLGKELASTLDSMDDLIWLIHPVKESAKRALEELR